MAKKILPVLIYLLIALLAMGTIVEKLLGTESALHYVYHAPYTIALWAVLAVGGIVVMVRSRMWQRPALCLLHVALLVILAGAMTTHLWGRFGELQMQPGQTYSAFEDEHGAVLHRLPFSITLQDFHIEYYPGSTTPMDFTSEVLVTETNGNCHAERIAMNKILKCHGYRFYQADFDGEGGSTLQVAHDPWGIGITYCGYLLLLAGLVGIFFDKRGGFRRLLRSPLLKTLGKRVTLILPLLLWAGAVQAGTPRTLPKESAQKLGELYVSYQGRVCPLQTLAQDFTTKLCGNPKYKGLTPEQVLSGWIFYYSDWKEEPLFKIKGAYVRQTLQLQGKYARLDDFVNVYNESLLDTALSRLPKGDVKRKKYREALEKQHLVGMLYSGDLLKLFPHADSTGTLYWYSQSDHLPSDIPGDEYLFIRKQLSLCQELVMKKDFATFDMVMEKTKKYQEQHAGTLLPGKGRVQAERCYNRLRVGKPLAMVGVTLGILFFALFMFYFGTGRTPSRVADRVGRLWMWCLCLLLLALFVLRWVAGGHVPLAGSYDTMLFVSLATCIFTLWFGRKFQVVLPFGMLVSGLTLLAAMMSGANPPVTHLMPVLSSPWLLLHVTVILIAYSLLFFVLLNGIAAIVLHYTGRHQQQENEERLQQLSLLLLYPAVALLTIGIFIGAVWANVSWGNYWSWDPKEVWALITLLVYALPLHGQATGSLRRPLPFHIYCVVAFLCVIITYFGVNILLGGMHAYN